MKRFEIEIAQAKKYHRKVQLLWFMAFSLIVLAAIIGALITNGTKVKIVPQVAASEGKIDILKGTGIAFGSMVYGLTGNVSIKISSPGFFEEDYTITENEVGKVIEVPLRERPAKIIGKTNPAVDKAAWSIDGVVLGEGTEFKHELKAGTYELVLSHPYYENHISILELHRAERREIEVKMNRLEGQLHLGSTPRAKVFVDKELLGTTPYSGKIEGGLHDIRVIAEGYKTVSETVEISQTRKLIERNYTLTHLPASLTLTVEPPGGLLLLNGREIVAETTLEVNSNNDLRISYVKEGYAGRSLSIQLTPGETRTVPLKLMPKIGLVDFRVGKNEEVLVNGESIGIGPKRRRYKAIDLFVEVRRNGYRSIKQKIRPSPVRTVMVRGGLQSLKHLAIQNAKPAYTNVAGQEMLLFKPSENFYMGASRGERGQRANEFIRRVQLDRWFYAALHETTNAAFKNFRKQHIAANNKPVHSLTWIEAAMFCNWLSKKSGLPSFYKILDDRILGFDAKSNGYRLLTEAEWEWLARKAGRGKRTIFTWGDREVVPENAGNIADETAKGTVKFFVPRYSDGYVGTAPVGSFNKEKSGLFDLFGNVSEWVNDAYILALPKRGHIEVNPLRNNVGPYHVVKGSNFRSGNLTTLRASYRDGSKGKRPDVGFRVGRYLYMEFAEDE